MYVLALVLALAGPIQNNWCDEQNWDRYPRRCLRRAELQERLQFLVTEAKRFAASVQLPAPQARPGGLIEANELVRAEVWHLTDGMFEIRIKPETLRDEHDATLTYIAAHEVCHIANGDANYGIWGLLSEEERAVRHRWTLACAFQLMGSDAYLRYLEEGSHLETAEQRQDELKRISDDAMIWRKRRGHP